jgi:arabinogalactan endo-1,4-beta-galactosidase
MRKSTFIGSCVSMLMLGISGAAAAATTPTVVNPGFEADGTGVATPTGWTKSGSVNASFTEFGGHGGRFRLSNWSADDYSVNTQQTVSGLDRGWYTARAWVKRSTGQNDASLELDCGSGVERTYLPIAPADEWLQIVVSAHVRRQHGSCTIVLHSTAAGGEWSNYDDIELVPGQAALSILGADVSSLKKSLDLGGEYFDDERTHQCRKRSALDILGEHGANAIRLRVWVNPADGHHNIRELAEMGRRAKEAGLGVLVDLHYSDSWADPGTQNKPAAWASFSVDQLEKAVFDHTLAACLSLRAEGVTPELVQLGNEINSGILFPDGSTWNPPNWPNLARFLKAGYKAVKLCSPRTKVMLHLANGGDNGAFRWWFDNITAQGVDFDVIGASYYMYWHGPLGALQFNLNDMASRYGKEVVVVETGYPFTLGFNDNENNLIGLQSQLIDGYPATPAGQAANFRDIMSIVRAVPNGRGLGAYYWEATWTAVPGNGWDPTNPASGDTWENQAMFDFDSRALPVMDEFKP